MTSNKLYKVLKELIPKIETQYYNENNLLDKFKIGILFEIMSSAQAVCVLSETNNFETSFIDLFCRIIVENLSLLKASQNNEFSKDQINSSVDSYFFKANKIIVEFASSNLPEQDLKIVEKSKKTIQNMKQHYAEKYQISTEKAEYLLLNEENFLVGKSGQRKSIRKHLDKEHEKMRDFFAFSTHPSFLFPEDKNEYIVCKKGYVYTILNDVSEIIKTLPEYKETKYSQNCLNDLENKAIRKSFQPWLKQMNYDMNKFIDKRSYLGVFFNFSYNNLRALLDLYALGLEKQCFTCFKTSIEQVAFYNIILVGERDEDNLSSVDEITTRFIMSSKLRLKKAMPSSSLNYKELCDECDEIYDNFVKKPSFSKEEFIEKLINKPNFFYDLKEEKTFASYIENFINELTQQFGKEDLIHPLFMLSLLFQHSCGCPAYKNEVFNYFFPKWINRLMSLQLNFSCSAYSSWNQFYPDEYAQSILQRGLELLKIFDNEFYFKSQETSPTAEEIITNHFKK